MPILDRKIGKWDVLLYIVCIITLVVAIGDLYSLDKIEDEVLTACNEHWMEQLEQKPTILSNTISTEITNYTFNLE